MLDTTTQTRLQDLLQRESRSFLQYVNDAFPWTTPDESPALAQLWSLIAEERRALVALGKFLARHRIPLPYLEPYPVAFTTLNFISLDHLLPLLVNSERRAITELERDQASFADPACRQEVQKLLEMKQQHVKTLETLAIAHPEMVAR